MKNLISKIQFKSMDLTHRIQQGIKKLMTEENGDTNFISIIIVLIIIVGIASLLITFRGTLTDKFNSIVTKFVNGLG